MGVLPPVVAELTANISEFSAKMAEAKAEMDDVKDSGNSSFSKLSSIGRTSLLAIGGLAAAVGAAAVDMGIKNQQATAQLAANANISVKSAQSISNAFLDTAGTSIYTGTAMTTAYAGIAAQLATVQGHALSTAQAILVMKSATDLAEASGTSLDGATAALGKTMQAFQVGAKGAQQASTVLFNVARMTGQGVNNVAQAFQRLHSQLGAVTPPLAQVGGLVADLTEHGETGRQSISAMNTSLTTLLGGLDPITAAQEKVAWSAGVLGVNLKNAKGQFVGMGSIIAQLQPRLEGMTQAQQLATLSTLFGSSANRKFLDTILAGPAAYDKATNAAKNHAAVQNALNAQMGTFKHQMEVLEATLEDYGAKLGNWLIPKLQTFVHVLGDVAKWLSQNKDVLYALGAAIGLFATVAIGTYAVGAMVKFKSSIEDAFTSLSKLVSKMTGFGSGSQGISVNDQTSATGNTAATTIETAMKSGGDYAAGVIEQAMRGGGTTAGGEIGTAEEAGGTTAAERIAAGEETGGAAVATEIGTTEGAAGLTAGAAFKGVLSGGVLAALFLAAWNSLHIGQALGVKGSQTNAGLEGAGAGAIVGGKVAGAPGAVIGAGVGATIGAFTHPGQSLTQQMQTALQGLENKLATEETQKTSASNLKGLLTEITQVQGWLHSVKAPDTESKLDALRTTLAKEETQHASVTAINATKAEIVQVETAVKASRKTKASGTIKARATVSS